MKPVDPNVVDFVKALARASAARDIARLKEREGDHREPAAQSPARRAARI